MNLSTSVYWVAVSLVVVLSSARLTRLATFDVFPPIKWVRDKYEKLTAGSDWQMLALCGYCASFWVTLVVVLWARQAGVLEQTPTTQGVWDGSMSGESVWWLVNGVFAASYLAAIVMANDGDDD